MKKKEKKERRKKKKERLSDVAKVIPLICKRVGPQTPICSLPRLSKVAGGVIRQKKLEKNL